MSVQAKLAPMILDQRIISLGCFRREQLAAHRKHLFLIFIFLDVPLQLRACENPDIISSQRLKSNSRLQ
jgi:hypothetical protein